MMMIIIIIIRYHECSIMSLGIMLMMMIIIIIIRYHELLWHINKIVCSQFIWIKLRIFVKVHLV